MLAVEPAKHVGPQQSRRTTTRHSSDEREEQARLEEEEDLKRTLEILRFTSARAEEEEAIKKQEDEDMSRTFALLAQAMSETESQMLRGERSHTKGKFVHFSPHIHIVHLPVEQLADARQARKKAWAAGPFHDELWDGDLGDFRDVELTSEELAALLKRRTTVATKLRGFFASRVVNIDAKSHARRLQTDDDDELVAEDEEQPPRLEKKRSSSRLLSITSWIRRASSTRTNGSRRSSKESEEPASSSWIAGIAEEAIAVEEDDDASATPIGSDDKLT